jgi:hypothetical protein
MIDPQEKYRLESSPPVDTGGWQNTEYPESHTGYTRHQGDPYGYVPNGEEGNTYTPINTGAGSQRDVPAPTSRDAAEPSVQPQQLAGAWRDGGARYNASEHVDGRGRV